MHGSLVSQRFLLLVGERKPRKDFSLHLLDGKRPQFKITFIQTPDFYVGPHSSARAPDSVSLSLSFRVLSRGFRLFQRIFRWGGGGGRMRTLAVRQSETKRRTRGMRLLAGNRALLERA